MSSPSFGGLIGPTTIGPSFGDWLDAVLSLRDMTEAVIASAFLTEESAERVIATLSARPTGKKPKITVLVGRMAGFTRAAAIRKLLEYAPGGKAAHSIPVTLNVLCPPSPQFHAKAVAIRRARHHLAAIGSHNLTPTGLDSIGELGVVLRGKAAKAVRSALDAWVMGSAPWKKVIKTYKEANLTSSTAAVAGVSKHFEGVAARAAESYLGEEELTKAELRLMADAEARFKRIAPRLDRKVSRVLWQSGSREDAILGEGYDRGAWFCHSGDGRVEDWGLSQKRSILEVVDVFPLKDRSNCIILAKNVVKSFSVDRETKRVAERLRVTKGRPSAIALARFTSYLKTGKLPG